MGFKVQAIIKLHNFNLKTWARISGGFVFFWATPQTFGRPSSSGSRVSHERIHSLPSHLPANAKIQYDYTGQKAGFASNHLSARSYSTETAKTRRGLRQDWADLGAENRLQKKKPDTLPDPEFSLKNSAKKTLLMWLKQCCHKIVLVLQILSSDPRWG